MMLTKSQRDKWAEELESGRWWQCYAKLRGDRNERCCLGVLADAVLSDPSGCYTMLNSILGLNPRFTFVRLNDEERLPFPEIAKHVRALPVSDEGSDG